MHLPWRPVAPALAGPAILTSVTADEATQLARLAAGRRVLEIGAAYGYSTVVLTLAGATVTSVDPHTVMPTYEQMLANLSAYGVDSSVTVHRGYSQDVLPELDSAGARFDVVFVDGDHVLAAVEHDVMWAQKLLTEGGVLAVHDYREDCCCPDVRVACDHAFGPDAQVTDTLRTVWL